MFQTFFAYWATLTPCKSHQTVTAPIRCGFERRLTSRFTSLINFLQCAHHPGMAAIRLKIWMSHPRHDWREHLHVEVCGVLPFV